MKRSIPLKTKFIAHSSPRKGKHSMQDHMGKHWCWLEGKSRNNGKAQVTDFIGVSMGTAG